tara:strand:- start:1755 stop:2672 length:918 start_codon:yes stop_codon:yes gene_type:complete
VTIESNLRSGYIAIVGRPNVGKSTLLNALVGEKVSIVSSKPHTTRHRILGVQSGSSYQAVFMDTPGLQNVTKGYQKRAIHRVMAKTINQVIEDADVILLVIDANKLTQDDLNLGGLLKERSEEVVLALNKIDTVGPRTALLPVLDKVSQQLPFSAFVPISALKVINLDSLMSEIVVRLPFGPALFPKDILTDKGDSFRIAEIIREKLLSVVHKEVPYGLTVEVEYVGRNEENQWLIHAVIWVERPSHKAIVIGKHGRLLKKAGQSARQELIKFLNDRVHLELWVKVREHWSDNERELKKLGFDLS